jgi:hypothetical protein
MPFKKPDDVGVQSPLTTHQCRPAITTPDELVPDPNPGDVPATARQRTEHVGRGDTGCIRQAPDRC